MAARSDLRRVLLPPRQPGRLRRPRGAAGLRERVLDRGGAAGRELGAVRVVLVPRGHTGADLRPGGSRLLLLDVAGDLDRHARVPVPPRRSGTLATRTQGCLVAPAAGAAELPPGRTHHARPRGQCVLVRRVVRVRPRLPAARVAARADAGLVDDVREQAVVELPAALRQPQTESAELLQEPAGLYPP